MPTLFQVFGVPLLFYVTKVGGVWEGVKSFVPSGGNPGVEPLVNDDESFMCFSLRLVHDENFNRFGGQLDEELPTDLTTILKLMFSPKVPSDEREDEANRAENKSAGHAGFDTPVVHVGRKLARQVVAEKRRQDVACQACEESDSEVFHKNNFSLDKASWR